MPEVEVQIRDYFAEIVEHIDVDELVAGTQLQPVPPPRRRWVVAIAAALAVLAAVGAVALASLLSSEQQSPVVTEPRLPETSLPEVPPVDLGVPPFQATVSVDTGSGMLSFAIDYGGPGGGYRWEALESGDYFIWDGGGEAAYYSAESQTVDRFTGQPRDDDLLGLGSLTLDSRVWAEQCGFDELNLAGASMTAVGTDTIAGRPVDHVRCGTPSHELDFWVDAETRLILRGSFVPFPDPVGESLDQQGLEFESFEFTSIAYGQMSAERFTVVVPEGWSDPHGERLATILATPSLYARISQTLFETEVVYDLWFDGINGSRRSWISRAGSDYEYLGPGSFEVWTGSEWLIYMADSNTYLRSETYEEPLGVLLERPGETCQTTGGTANHLGRAVEVHRCAEDEIWIDVETGLILKRTGSGGGHEVLDLDLAPTFPAGIFTYELPEGALEERLEFEGVFSGRHIGQPLAPLTGSYLDGEPFELAGLLGRPAVVVFWGSECPPCVDHLAPLQQAVEAFGDQVAFLTVLSPHYESDPQNAAALLGREGYTFSAVVPDDLSIYEESGLVPAIPTTVLVEADGTVTAVVIGLIADPDAYGLLFDQAGF